MEEIEKELQELKQQLQEEQELCRREKEAQQGQTQQEAQHAQIEEIVPIQVIDSSKQLAQIEEIVPIQVIDSSKQLAQSRQGEKSQEQNLVQGIEMMLEQMDMDLLQPESEQDIDLMPHNQEVTPLASPDPEAEKFPSN